MTANTKIELTDGVTGMDKINGISATNIGCQNLQALNAQIDGTLQTSGNLDESILAKGYFGFANIENYQEQNGKMVLLLKLRNFFNKIIYTVYI